MLKKISLLIAGLIALGNVAQAVQINGQLEKAGLERLTSDPTAFAGRIYYNTTNSQARWYNGAWRTACDLNSTQTLSGKTYATPTFSGTMTTPLGAGILHSSSGGVLSSSAVSLSSEVSGNLPVANLGSGTGASSSTFWRGDGSWATPVALGDVTGPAASVDSEIALFSSTTGKVIKRMTGTGVVHSTSGVASVGNVDLTSEVTGVLPRANGGASYGTVSGTTLYSQEVAGAANSTCSTGTCGNNFKTSGISSIIWASAGNYTVSFTGSPFSSAPNCFGSSITRSSGAFCQQNGSCSTSSCTISCYVGSTLTNDNPSVICIGPK